MGASTSNSLSCHYLLARTPVRTPSVAASLKRPSAVAPLFSGENGTTGNRREVFLIYSLRAERACLPVVCGFQACPSSDYLFFSICVSYMNGFQAYTSL